MAGSPSRQAAASPAQLVGGGLELSAQRLERVGSSVLNQRHLPAAPGIRDEIVAALVRFVPLWATAELGHDLIGDVVCAQGHACNCRLKFLGVEGVAEKVVKEHDQYRPIVPTRAHREMTEDPPIGVQYDVLPKLRSRFDACPASRNWQGFGLCWLERLTIVAVRLNSQCRSSSPRSPGRSDRQRARS